MLNVVQLAGAGASILGATAGLLAYVASRGKNRNDYDIAIRQIQAKAEADKAAAEHAARQDEIEKQRLNLAEWQSAYDRACRDRDNWERLCKEARTDAETLRAMWRNWGTTLDDVVEREMARYERDQRHKET